MDPIPAILGILCVGTIVAGIIAMVGHTLWLIFGWLFRVLTNSDFSANRAVPGGPCSACSSPHSVVNGTCRLCGTPAMTSETAKRIADLNATQRLLDLWLQAGKITAEQRAALAQLLDEERATQASRSHPTGQLATPIALPTPPAPHASGSMAAQGTDRDESVITAQLVSDHPLDRVATSQPPPSTEATVPRRTIADMLQAFMEQKNIRWVELLSGLLIVGCATGLVISLRAALQDKIPYFPALSFLLVTGAFHAAGIYSLRRWNLKSTSRGVLIIATLLVPLSILAAILLGGEGDEQRAASDPVFLLAVGIGLLSFGTMNYFAARALLRHGWWRMMVGILGTSVGQLIVNRLHHAGMSPAFAALITFPAVGAFVFANFAQLAALSPRRKLKQRDAHQFFLELGVSTFAFLAPIGLFIAESPSIEFAMRVLSPELSLASTVLIACGLFAYHRFTLPSLAALQTTGIALALFGAALMVRMAAFAWPDLTLLIAVGLINFVTLTLLAATADLALLHVLAVGCSALAYFGGFYLWHGLPNSEVDGVSARLTHVLFTGLSGAALTVFATAIAAVGLGLHKKWRRDVGDAYLIASGALATLAIAIAVYAGFWRGPPAGGDWATVLLLYFAIAAFVIAWFIERPEPAWLSSSLLLAAGVHGFWLNDRLSSYLASIHWKPDEPILVAALVHSAVTAVVATAAAAIASRLNAEGRQSKRGTIIRPLIWSALVTSIGALPFAIYVGGQNFAVHSIYLLAACCAWLAFALLERAKWAWTVFQGIATVSLIYCVTAVSMRQSWWADNFLDARHLHLQLVALAGECILWMLIREFGQRPGRPLSWLADDDAVADQAFQMLLVAAVPILALIGCLPGISHELGKVPGITNPPSIEVLPYLSGTAWLSLFAVYLSIAVRGWLRWSSAVSAAVVILSIAVPLQIAVQFTDQIATASAVRWLFAGFAVFWCVVACTMKTDSATQIGESARSDAINRFRAMRTRDVFREISLAVALFAVIAVTTMVLMRVASGDALGGPLPTSWFTGIGSTVSYATPLLALTIVLYVYAIRESSPGYVFGASLVFQYFTVLACVLPVFAAGGTLEVVTWAKILQWSAVASGVSSCVWVASRSWIEPAAIGRGPFTNARDLDSQYLQVQFLLQFAGLLIIAIWSSGEILSDPGGQLPVVHRFGLWPSYVAILLAAASVSWATRHQGTASRRDHMFHFLALIAVTVVAATVHRYDSAGTWAGAHALAIGWTVMATLSVGWMCWQMRAIPLTAPTTDVTAVKVGVPWESLAIVLAEVTVLMTFVGSPNRTWELVAAISVVILTGIIGVRARLQPYAYASLICAAISGTLIHFYLPVGSPFRTGTGLVLQVSSEVLLVAAIWLAWEVWFQRRREPGISPRSIAAAHRTVAHAATVFGLLFIVVMSIHVLLGRSPMRFSPTEIGSFVTLFLVFFGLQLGTFWDERSRFGAMALYVGLMMIGVFVVDRLAWTHSPRTVALMTLLAIQVTVSGWVWSWGGKLAALGSRLGMRDPIEHLRRTDQWLVVVNLILAAVVLVTSTFVVLAAESRELRVTAACLPVLLAVGFLGIAQRAHRNGIQLVTLLTATWGLVLLGWSDIPPDHSWPLVLARAIRLLMACVTAAFILTIVVVRVMRPTSPWRRATNKAVAIWVVGSLVSLAAVLGLEVATFQPGIGAPVETTQVVAVTIILVGLIATLISLAVLPGKDPFELSEQGRMAYVYGAQLVAALLFAHIYLAHPILFHGRLRKYWPYIVVLIAFAGVGIGTLFERLQSRVLAEPFQRSGAFLPLIPAIGMWFVTSGSNYALVLFVIGVLYVLLSFVQRSAITRAAAAISGNGALWAMLEEHPNLSFDLHPQFWLIPPALSAIVAAQLNRHRLTDGQVAAIRYVAVGVIYLSSSFEMLKIGIGESLWPPVILILLALAGVVFGIAMQIRAYLYLGSIFVLVSLVSMVAHASQSIHHVWPWWAFGILLGTSMLVVFGYFEGRRSQILQLIERLRQWEK